MVLRLRKPVVHCTSSVRSELLLTSSRKVYIASFYRNVFRTVRWKLCKRWTIFISPSIHRETRLVELFTYLLSNDLSRNSASNSIRLFSVFRSTHPICLRTETLQGLVSTMCRLQAANDHCVRSGEPWGVHSMCQVLWTYEHSLVLPGS